MNPVSTTSPSHSPMSMSASNNKSKQRHGFTLIELLIVITIIAVLAGMAFPVTGAVMNSARKIQAKNDMANLVNAIKAYQLEYHQYPDMSTGSGDQVATNEAGSSALMNELLGDNPRRINFFEPKYVETARGGYFPSSAPSGTGALYDPWGNVYYVAVDRDYDNTLTDPDGGGTINRGVIVYSSGPDAQPGTPPTPSSKAIYSWK